ncbi:MAG: Ku protein [Tepidisphaeraceae bacterium]
MAAAARSVWKGFIQFSLVSVPVRAYAAAASAGSGGEIRLNQLHAECNNRIKYQKVCPVHGEVKQDEIVSGYEFAKDQYVIIDPAEIEKLRKPSEKAIQIDAFIKPDAIDERYFSGRTQYLLPEGAPAFKAYALLHRALVETGRVAFAKVVLAGKQQLVVVRPLENLLAMSFLNYAAEVKPVADFRDESPTVEVDRKELDLAKTLTKSLAVDDFDLAEHADDYKQKLTQLIEAKQKGEEIISSGPAEAAQPQVSNLMEALQASLAQAKKAAPAAKGKPGKLVAPSVGVAEAKETKKRKKA